METYVNLPVLGLIPYVAIRDRSEEESFIPDELRTPLPSSRCIAYHEPKSIIAVMIFSIIFIVSIGVYPEPILQFTENAAPIISTVISP